MRWDALFTDMEAQLEAAERWAKDSEISERTRIDVASIALLDRLRASLGTTIGVHLAGGQSFSGQLTHVGAESSVVASTGTQALFSYSAVHHYSGVSRFAVEAAPSRLHPLGLASALRIVSQNREVVELCLAHNASSDRVYGLLERVGRDSFDVAIVRPGEIPRPSNVRDVWAVPFHSLQAVVSRGVAPDVNVQEAGD
ncbi:hypothetical protein [Pseudarthrobacter sp. PS3-L1]|uniref:hypothetical protein n=1 Tax=Pseudarthrobacter sp. PS3-L1 TaxID=3046207 RepID=UPI0024BB5C76|nr:hypothetical protein [Pseudarthrobacter sp. PS3-L1]MDJ0321486.1 hypothetical protein [Pseudarthrobacter sp. PS3-L1]